MEEELRWGREKLSLSISRDGSTVGLRSRSPLPKSISLLPGALTWLGQEPALSLGSEGGERLLSRLAVQALYSGEDRVIYSHRSSAP